MGATQDKGNLAVTQAIATFTRLGLAVLLPVVEGLPYDLVVDTGEDLKRIQVKYISTESVDLRRIHSNSQGYVIKIYNRNAYDWLYILRADGREYLIKECLTCRSVIPLEEEQIERWREESPRGKVPTYGGENNHFAKFTPEQIVEIRKSHSEGIGIRELARQYGVTHSTIQAIVRRRTWTHIP